MRIIITIITSLISVNLSAQRLPDPLPGGLAQHLPAGVKLDLKSNPYAGRWKILLNEEFSSWPLNSAIWSIMNACPSSSANVSVAGDYLYLKTTQNHCGAHQSNQGEIRTRDDFSNAAFRQVYERGMFQARIKFSKAFWAHETFWIWGANGEIDIAEHYGYRDFKNREFDFVLHNYYKDIGNTHPSYDLDHRCLETYKHSHNLGDDFHIYTAIWDKNFIYFYFDNAPSPTYIKPRFNIYSDPSTKIGGFIGNTTFDGFYYPMDCFFSLNATGQIVLSSGLDDKESKSSFTDFRRRSHKQYEGLPANMVVDWVRVYQRVECDEDVTIPNSILMPYHQLSHPYPGFTKESWTSLNSITLGTQGEDNWTNIVPQWEPGYYKAKAITMLPNFISYPQIMDPTPNDPGDPWATKPSSFLYEARNCYSTNGISEDEDEYITPEFSEEEIHEDTFDCNDIDTAYIDSIISYANSNGYYALADSVISFLGDSLGCPYWSEIYGGGEGKRGRGSHGGSTFQYPITKNQTYADRIRIYPNPTIGSFNIEIPQRGNYTILVTNMLSTTVYEGKMVDEQKTSINLDNNLPPGNYTIHISGDGVRHVERVTLIR